MKPGRYFALIAGLLFLGLGLAGFVPSLAAPADGIPETITNYYGIVSPINTLFGIFPTNAVESVFYLIWGVFGAAAAISLDSARLFAGLTAVLFGTLTLLGFIPYGQSVFGLFPVYGSDIWLHGAISVAAAYFGFIARPDLKEALEKEVAIPEAGSEAV